jgi:Ca2+-binding RTX toxin-like protein
VRKLVLFGLAALAFGQAAVAEAGTVSFTGSVLAYDAAPGEANRIFVFTESGGVRAVDTGAPVTAGAGCASVGLHEAFCANIDYSDSSYIVRAGDMDDYVSTSGAALARPSRLQGGAGDDRLDSGWNQTLDGGPGADVFITYSGTIDYSSRTDPVTVTVGDGKANDGEAGEHDLVPRTAGIILGGHASDTITSELRHSLEVRAGGGNDSVAAPGSVEANLFGGPGNDSLQAGEESGLAGEEGNDTLKGGEGTQRASGGPGDDVMRGGPGRDYLWAESGADLLIGGRGIDALVAGPGDDTLRSRDASKDKVAGGKGTDSGRVDRFDRVTGVEKLLP